MAQGIKFGIVIYIAFNIFLFSNDSFSMWNSCNCCSGFKYNTCDSNFCGLSKRMKLLMYTLTKVAMRN